MRKTREPIPSLFDVAPALAVGSPLPAMELPTLDPAKFQHPRRPGSCIEPLKFWTGNIAVKEGPVEIERNSSGTMIYIHQNGRLVFTFSGEHLTDLNKFHRHFREEEP